MQTLFDYIVEILKMNTISGVYKYILVSFTLTFIITGSVIIIGYLMNQFEQWQMKLLSKVFGQRFANFICNKLTFIGTIIHECSHALFVVLTGAKLLRIKCITLFNKTELGYVEFKTRGRKPMQMIQLSLVSCAPVVMGLILNSIFITLLLTNTYSLWITVIGWYLVVSIFDHMSMSMVDITNYCKGLLFIAPCLFTIFMFLQYISVNV